MSGVRQAIVERVHAVVPQSDPAAVERLAAAFVELFALKEESVKPEAAVGRDAFAETNASLRELIAVVREMNASMNRRFEEVNRRFDDVNKRFDDVNKRFAQLTWIVSLLFGSVTVLLAIVQLAG